MRIRAKLYGTLGRRFPAYEHAQGIEVEIPEGATVKELLALLDIPDSQKPVVAIDGRIRKPDEPIEGGAHVHVFDPIHGG